MSTENLKVEFAALDHSAADISASANAIDGRLDQLESELAPLRSDWTGAASESYQQAKAKWDAGMADIKALLTEIGTHVNNANSDYRSTENSNQARWS